MVFYTINTVFSFPNLGHNVHNKFIYCNWRRFTMRYSVHYIITILWIETKHSVYLIVSIIIFHQFFNMRPLLFYNRASILCRNVYKFILDPSILTYIVNIIYSSWNSCELYKNNNKTFWTFYYHYKYIFRVPNSTVYMHNIWDKCNAQFNYYYLLIINPVIDVISSWVFRKIR